MSRTDRNVISIRDFTRKGLEDILELAQTMEGCRGEPYLTGRILATLFFEPSTRTRLSFESAMKLLGGEVIGFSDPGLTSLTKGETIRDTVRMVESYADCIVVRHPLEGVARYISEVSKVPVINAGDGSNQHPTQTCLDLYTIQKCHGRIDDLTIGFLGDLKYGRTVHSLAVALSHFGARMFFISSPQLRMPEAFLEEVRANQCECIETGSMQDVLPKLDVLYATRIQKERFPDPVEYEKQKGIWRIDLAALSEAKKSLKVLHPLPRGLEIASDIDGTPYAQYYQQAANGVPVRQALLCMLLEAGPCAS